MEYLEKILNMYRAKFGYDMFYDNLFYNIETWPDFHITNSRFLSGYPFEKRKVIFENQRSTESGNIRVDLPVWFGNIKHGKRIVFLGLEPRDTDNEGYLNIEHNNNNVFGTPFALERPYSPYQKAFSHLFENPNLFSYFTDVVKEYYVKNKDDKNINDAIARKNFAHKAEEGIEFLKEELKTISPVKVFALGKQTFLELDKHFHNDFDIVRLIHPARNRQKQCKQQIDQILQSI
jgi:hypothetical protein